MTAVMTVTARYPLQPLLDWINTTHPHDAQRILHLSGTTYERLTTHGLTDRQADRYATRLGTHPAVIWGHLWWDNAPDPD